MKAMNPMRRRDFARLLAGATLGSVVLPAFPALAATTETQPPFRFSVMLWTIYRKLPFDQRLEKVAEAGYHAVELVDEYKNWSPEEFRRASAKLRSLGIVVDAMAGVWTGIANPQAQEKFLGLRIGNSGPYAGHGVHHDTQRTQFCRGTTELFRGPVFIFIDQFVRVIAGFGDLL